jgi:hypothetical protein
MTLLWLLNGSTKNERIKYVMALHRCQATNYMQQPTKNRGRAEGGIVFEARPSGGMWGVCAFDRSGADKLEGGKIKYNRCIQ